MRGLAELVSVLVRHDVRFIIVGGMAGALQGAPVNTLDLEASDQLDLAGQLVHVLSLERLIRVKEKLARPKDRQYGHASRGRFSSS